MLAKNGIFLGHSYLCPPNSSSDSDYAYTLLFHHYSELNSKFVKAHENNHILFEYTELGLFQNGAHSN